MVWITYQIDISETDAEIGTKGEVIWDRNWTEQVQDQV
jgi:hypothetical protein